MQLRRKNISRPFWLMTALVAMSLGTQAAYSQSNKPETEPTNVDPVVLEVSIKGAGMVSPQGKQLYFRLYKSGRLEGQLPPRFDPEADRASFEPIKWESTLNAKDADTLIKLAGQSDFLNAAEKYPALEHWTDAVTKTTITYKYQNRKKQITITNYQPDHPRAKSYYPASLIELLRRVDQLRPQKDK